MTAGRAPPPPRFVIAAGAAPGLNTLAFAGTPTPASPLGLTTLKAPAAPLTQASFHPRSSASAAALGATAASATAASAPLANAGGSAGPLTSAQPRAPDLSARFFTSPSELRDELAVHEIASRLYAGVEIEGQSSFARQDHDTANDTYFDSITGALRWVPMYGLNFNLEGSFDLQNSDGFTLDEGTFTLGAVPTMPWYLTIGRTSLPFGEFNSHFREDPATQILGEIQGRELAGGYESDNFELTFAMRQGNSGNQSFSWVSNVTFSPLKDMDVGFFYASDLSKAAEIQVLIEDARALDTSLPQANPAVHGTGAFMSWQKNYSSLDAECITALQDFAPGLVSDSPGKVRPWACNVEATVRPTGPWEIGFRLERSAHLRDSPEFQFGIETSYGFGAHAAIRFEFLHGKFADAGDRDQVTASLVMRW